MANRMASNGRSGSTGDAPRGQENELDSGGSNGVPDSVSLPDDVVRREPPIKGQQEANVDGSQAAVEGLADRLRERRRRGGVTPPDDPTIERQCPLLWGLLTQDEWKGGGKRELPTLKIERTGGGYVVQLQDHATRQAVHAVSRTLQGLWRALEACLRDPNTVWRDFASFKVSETALAKMLKGG